ncbi:MAG TPA: phosphatase PAP2 family protein, partial [Acetobacteraceae bacterium]|nr:phosphatase PAP2 family protein [Acetobacteraceae bacterium]
QHLIDLARTQRPARMAEIVEQYSGYRQYFVHLLAIGPESRPATYLLLKMGSRIAEFVMTYFKDKFNRPRPSQYCPALMPPVGFAGIPSYPGGHALVGHLMALSVSEAAPELREALQVLADRIGNNMEIGGFHFPSDTTAGRDIAGSAIELLRKCDSFSKAVDAAKREW